MPHIAFTFSGKNPDAQRAAIQQGGLAIRQVSDETRGAVRALIAQGITDGIPPARLARLVQQTVGLTARQARGVANLDTQLRRAGIKPSRVKARVESYRNRQLRRRARTIARTETMGALNRGKLESGRAATKEGLFNNPEKRWVLTPDERLCPLCSPMENETVPLEDSFSNNLSAPPRHPQCRCTISITEADERAASADLRRAPRIPQETPQPAGVPNTPDLDIPNVRTFPGHLQRDIQTTAKLLKPFGINLVLDHDYDKLLEFSKTGSHFRAKRASAAAIRKAEQTGKKVRRTVNAGYFLTPEELNESMAMSLRGARDGLAIMQKAGLEPMTSATPFKPFAWSDGTKSNTASNAFAEWGNRVGAPFSSGVGAVSHNLAARSKIWRTEKAQKAYQKRVQENRQWSSGHWTKVRPGSHSFVHEFGHARHFQNVFAKNTRGPADRIWRSYSELATQLERAGVRLPGVTVRPGTPSGITNRASIGFAQSHGLVDADNNWTVKGATRQTTTALQKLATNGVSEYAGAAYPVELVAEMFAAMAEGQTFGTRLMAIYNFLEGP